MAAVTSEAAIGAEREARWRDFVMRPVCVKFKALFCEAAAAEVVVALVLYEDAPELELELELELEPELEMEGFERPRRVRERAALTC